MSNTTTQQSKILSIDEQIKKLQEKKNREIAKLERSVGKKFIEVFDKQSSNVNEIHKLIDDLKEMYGGSKVNNIPAAKPSLEDTN